jgi:hypothetical protein
VKKEKKEKKEKKFNRKGHSSPVEYSKYQDLSRSS